MSGPSPAPAPSGSPDTQPVEFGDAVPGKAGEPTGRPPGEAATAERRIERLLDANLDRAREGLRVLEDWARFGLNRADLVARCKDLRQRLGQCHRDRYRAARQTATDVAAGMEHPAQAERRGPEAVLRANAARVQEALRVLEEFGRERDPELASQAAACRYALYDLDVALLKAGQGDQDRRSRLSACHLYLITRPMDGLEAMVAGALAAGVRLVQYRAKEGDANDAQPLDDRRRLAEARALRALCDRHGALLIINDRIDLALAVEADGVHLGQGDLPPALARSLLGPQKLIGRSTHELSQLHQAIRDGCDYVGVGPVHATPSKPGRQPVGLEYVRQALACSPIPCFAIGGIGADEVPTLRAAGANRVAVVRAISAAADPQAAAAALLTMLEASA
ncbi:MAG: thiamine phosphate synthase [Synechococcaceae cyanobacterium]|nr:thiamine phosphate synthase [Synechococcaceae cyanobacterium]